MGSPNRPLLALTMGDVAGVGPEVIARAWQDFEFHELARPIVVGNRLILERALTLVGRPGSIQPITHPNQAESSPSCIPCLEGSPVPLGEVRPGQIDRNAGQAAADFLTTAIDLALSNQIDAIVTLPLNKESLHAAGVPHPGHTEILAERCGVPDHAMMLYLETPLAKGRAGLGVIHATLHVSLRSIFQILTKEHILGKIGLADEALRPFTEGRPPRIAVAGLNPHAGENGLFGAEEITIIEPAVRLARSAGIQVVGPIPADTLFHRAIEGEFDAVVAMYHDQGHVALKTIGFEKAVNVTLGLPIVRTSVAHGTAFDIAWKGFADTTSLIAATRVAAKIVSGRGRIGEQL